MNTSTPITRPGWLSNLSEWSLAQYLVDAGVTGVLTMGVHVIAGMTPIQTAFFGLFTLMSVTGLIMGLWPRREVAAAQSHGQERTIRRQEVRQLLENHCKLVGQDSQGSPATLSWRDLGLISLRTVFIDEEVPREFSAFFEGINDSNCQEKMVMAQQFLRARMALLRECQLRG